MASLPNITVAPLEDTRVFRGCSLVTSEKNVFDDAAKLARDFAGVKESVAGRAMPVVTGAVSFSAGVDGTYRYFMGDEVAGAARKKPQDGLEDVVVPAGTLVAVVPVKFRLQAVAALSAAQVRKAFYEDWLPGSGYESAADELGFADVELYHYRRRRFRRARKMVLNLMFLVREKA